MNDWDYTKSVYLSDCPIHPFKIIEGIRADNKAGKLLIFHCETNCKRYDNCPWIPTGNEEFNENAVNYIAGLRDCFTCPVAQCPQEFQTNVDIEHCKNRIRTVLYSQKKREETND